MTIGSVNNAGELKALIRDEISARISRAPFHWVLPSPGASDGIAEHLAQVLAPLMEKRVTEALTAERTEIAGAIGNPYQVIAIRHLTISESTLQRMGPVLTTQDVQKWIRARGVETPVFAALSDEDREIIRGLASAPIRATDEWPRSVCTGDYGCPAKAHVHGCLSDVDGNCNDPEEHDGKP